MASVAGTPLRPCPAPHSEPTAPAQSRGRHGPSWGASETDRHSATKPKLERLISINTSAFLRKDRLPLHTVAEFLLEPPIRSTLEAVCLSGVCDMQKSSWHRNGSTGTESQKRHSVLHMDTRVYVHSKCAPWTESPSLLAVTLGVGGPGAWVLITGEEIATSEEAEQETKGPLRPGVLL